MALGWWWKSRGLDDPIGVCFAAGVGVATTVLLPDNGFDTEQQNAGYLFYDAYRRDLQGWDLAVSDQPLWASFREEFTTDQYATGLLSLSAAVYRYLSPDAHRLF